MTRAATRLVLAILLLALAACGRPEQLRKVRLSPEGQAPVVLPDLAPRAPLRVAVAPVISPRESFALYTALFDQVSRRIDRPVEILQRRTYAEINDLIRYGHADVAFVCDYAYVEGARTFGMQLLVAPVVMGQSRYRSYIIVPRGSDARSFYDLRGRSFAFSDPLSSSGWLFPTDLLRAIGETPESFFKSHVFTYGHDNSVRAIADGLADGAAVDSLVYESMIERDPEYARKTTIIGISEAWGTPPVVVHPRMDVGLRERLREVFMTLHEEEGRRALAPLLIDRFIAPDDRAYDDVRQMAARVEGR